MSRSSCSTPEARREHVSCISRIKQLTKTENLKKLHQNLTSLALREKVGLSA